MPLRGDIRSVPVPGCVDGWLALHERFGRAPLADVLAPAIAAARDGFVASPLLCFMAALAHRIPGAHPLAADPADVRPDGTLRRDARCVRPAQAEVLEAVIAEGRSGYYEGTFGRGLLELGQGEYVEADLARPLGEWVAPVSVAVWGATVWTVPPPSQGYLALAGAAVASLAGIGPAGPTPSSSAWVHLLVEAAKAVGANRPDVLHEAADGHALLADLEVGRLAAAIDHERAQERITPTEDGGTIYLCATDGDGRGVSLIQSNAADFGSHLAEPNTGTFLHNRGIGFSLTPGHPAEYGPGRRPPSTLSPTLVTGPDGELEALVGTMGGDSQPQVVLQLLARLLADGEVPSAAVSAPRWRLRRDGDRNFDLWDAVSPPDAREPVGVAVESDAPAAWGEGLRRRGHEVSVVGAGDHGMGHAHVIARDGVGTWVGASDPRCLTPGARGARGTPA